MKKKMEDAALEEEDSIKFYQPAPGVLTATTEIGFLNKTDEFCNVYAKHTLTMTLNLPEIGMSTCTPLIQHLQDVVRYLALEEYELLKKSVDALPCEMVLPPSSYPRKRKRKNEDYDND